MVKASDLTPEVCAGPISVEQFVALFSSWLLSKLEIKVFNK